MSRYLSIFLGIFLCSFHFHAYSQILGCTDPQATNYNENAEINDGSCLYPVTSYTPILIDSLSETIQEVSGLIYESDNLWTHNDSGSEPYLFLLNHSGEIIKTVYVNTESNIDWEAITQDEEYIYIGDFGNNYGIRTDLKINKIQKSILSTSDTVTCEVIHFNYPEQLVYDDSLNGTDFDCEAFISYGDSLYLFTKNWLSLKTNVYSLPKSPGSYPAKFIQEFNVEGLITDASIDPTQSGIILLGYQKNSYGIYQIFTWLLTDFSYPSFFNGNKRRISMGSALSIGQSEGIALTQPRKGYMVSEAIYIPSLGINSPSKLHEFDLTHLYTPSHIHDYSLKNNQTVIFPNPTKGDIFINDIKYEGKSFQLFNIHNQLFKQGKIINNKINTEGLPNGNYIIKLEDNSHFIFTKNL